MNRGYEERYLAVLQMLDGLPVSQLVATLAPSLPVNRASASGLRHRIPTFGQPPGASASHYSARRSAGTTDQSTRDLSCSVHKTSLVF